ncbi:hypothetical protein ABPG72_011678 [Tetrahymena utriculariae]
MGKHISRFARGAIMILKQMNYSLGESKDILHELGFELDRIQLKYVRLYTLRSQNAIKHKIYLEQKSRGEQLDEDSKKKIIEMFSKNNAMSVKKAAEVLKIEAKYITAYLKSQNIQIKNKIKVDNDQLEEKYLLENLKNNILEILDQDPEWKSCVIRILFPKIKFGQIRQFERYFLSLTSEVRYSSIKFIQYQEGERFFGRGSFIYIHTVYDPLIYISLTYLEKFLSSDIPNKFFSSNPVIDACKLKIFDSQFFTNMQDQGFQDQDNINLDQQLESYNTDDYIQIYDRIDNYQSV